jgi:two-component system, chemotaxis family, protein-glutamate methylesterase/glutaminase
VITPSPENKREAQCDPSSPRIRVLIVDDSALMRHLLADLLSSAPEIEVVGTARNGREAIAQAVRVKPDIITLDVEMPEVSGLEALPTLLAVHNAPVVMVSALTQEGADVTLQALELGAFDFMPKPERNQLGEMRANRDLLVSKVLAAAQSRVARRPRSHAYRINITTPHTGLASTSKVSAPSPSSSDRGWACRSVSPTASISGPTAQCVVIGISTGGPQALSQLFPLLSAPVPPILVVQHMPAQFTKVFAQRLDRYSSLTIKEAEDGDLLILDHAFVAPGGRHMTLTGHGPHVRICLSDEAPVSGHRPSIDVLFRAAARVYQSATVGLLMTGMGRDGVEGCRAIRAAGGFTLGQDEETSAVYGMNKAAFLEGTITVQFALDDLPGILRNLAAFRAEIESPTAST